LETKLQNILSRLESRSNRERQGKTKVPPGQQMLAITADTGQFFSILLKAIKARRVLEVGTSTGFSTMWFADAVRIFANGSKPRIITIEENLQKIERARKNFEYAGVDNVIEIKEGTALDILPHIKKKNYFDFVFLDADKENIIKYFDLVLPMVRIGGIVAADNMLYPKQYGTWMKKYAKHVRGKRNVQSVTIPIGMGEEISIRLR
jgi:predicted O-methyltransferase YrrM